MKFKLLCFICTIGSQVALAQASPSDILKSDCESLIKDETAGNGTPTRNSAEPMIISADGKNKLTFEFMDMDQSIVIAVVATGAGDCIDESNKITFSFRDGTRLSMINDRKFNCDAAFAVFMGGGFGKKKELGLLLVNEIQSVRVETRKSTIDKQRKTFVEETFTPDQSKAFIKILTCLLGG